MSEQAQNTRMVHHRMCKRTFQVFEHNMSTLGYYLRSLKIACHSDQGV